MLVRQVGFKSCNSLSMGVNFFGRSDNNSREHGVFGGFNICKREVLLLLHVRMGWIFGIENIKVRIFHFKLFSDYLPKLPYGREARERKSFKGVRPLHIHININHRRLQNIETLHPSFYFL